MLRQNNHRIAASPSTLSLASLRVFSSLASLRTRSPPIGSRSAITVNSFIAIERREIRRGRIEEKEEAGRVSEWREPNRSAIKVTLMIFFSPWADDGSSLGRLGGCS